MHEVRLLRASNLLDFSRALARGRILACEARDPAANIADEGTDYESHFRTAPLALL